MNALSVYLMLGCVLTGCKAGRALNTLSRVDTLLQSMANLTDEETTVYSMVERHVQEMAWRPLGMPEGRVGRR